MKRSLSRRFLVSVGVTTLVVTILTSVVAFLGFQRELTDRQMRYLADYVRERSSNVDRRFSTLTALHAAAAAELQRRVDRITPQQAERLTELYFPPHGDGTRRSRPEDFDGALNADGGFTYGMGAFLRDADALTPQDKAVLVSAFDVVSSFGQAAHAAYDNFYFFTPDTRLVMYGPDRPDRLMFYRQDAPASLDIRGEEMARLTTPEHDPTRATRCTNLQRLIQDQTGERLATGCMTPVYVHGRYVGSFGSSIELTGFFMEAVRSSLPEAETLVITSHGELIATPGFAKPGRMRADRIAEYEGKLHLKELVAAIGREPAERTSGVISSPDGRSIVAYGRLAGPDWYLLIEYPKAAMAASAAGSAAWTLLLGAAASGFQMLLVVGLARREIVRPLQALAASSEAQGGREALADIERRRDEIGVLAQALRAERDKVDDVMASLEDRVRERTAQLERANAEKSRFLANMSHELRTPLNGVIAVSESLAQQQATARGRELAELIVSSGRLLEQVLTDILDFSKIEAGEITLSQEAFSVRAMVGRIAELHRAAAETKGLRFEWRVAPEADAHVLGDSVRLTQVLSNLLSNAVKFTAEGSVRLEVVRDGDALCFSVADTGIGFDDEVKARLFRRFEQADDSIRRRFGGTGLGLAISRSLVELMGGAMEVTSAPGVGSTFRFRVMLAETAADDAAEDAGQSGELELAGRRVLLAEDHPTNQKVVQLILNSVGLDPVVVENGALALERLKAERFDVVLMDMQMPELDGLSATARLREHERTAGLQPVPVIMLTANALDEHILAGRRAGADMHLSKPIRAAALIEAIVQAIAARDAGSVPLPSARVG